MPPGAMDQALARVGDHLRLALTPIRQRSGPFLGPLQLE
jgi:hypothetical protein